MPTSQVLESPAGRVALMSRLQARIETCPMTGCWLWRGWMNSDGYGRYKFSDRGVMAHRLVYVLSGGEIPDGKVIDHLCRVRCCVNPGHLEVVTNRTNVLRGEGVTAAHARKTHCPKGHALSEENTIYQIQPGRFTSRRCRICQHAMNINRNRGKKPKHEESGG